MNESAHHIGEVASRTGLSLRTVRYYESVGLVVPSGRTAGGFRLYTERDIERLLLVRALRPVEFTPEEVRELLDLRDHVERDGTADRAPTIARLRLEALLEDAATRLRLKRERLIAAELVVQLLRGSRADEPSEAVTS